MFTTKYTKGAKKHPRPFVKKFAEGGSVPSPDKEQIGNRSLGEHIKAMGRAIFEPKEFREVYESRGKRDRANPYYDRKDSNKNE